MSNIHSLLPTEEEHQTTQKVAGYVFPVITIVEVENLLLSLDREKADRHFIKEEIDKHLKSPNVDAKDCSEFIIYNLSLEKKDVKKVERFLKPFFKQRDKAKKEQDAEMQKQSAEGILSPVSDEVLSILFLSIRLDATEQQRIGVRATIEERLATEDSTPEGAAKDICANLGIIARGNAKKIQAVLVPLWENKGVLSETTDEAGPEPESDDIPEPKRQKLHRLRDKIVALDKQIASMQKQLNGLRQEREALDDLLLDEVGRLNQEELQFSDEIKTDALNQAVTELKNPDLKLPENTQVETEMVQCGMCDSLSPFPLAENQEHIEEGFAYERRQFPKSIKKKLPEMVKFVCGKCYFDKLYPKA